MHDVFVLAAGISCCNLINEKFSTRQKFAAVAAFFLLAFLTQKAG